MKKTDTLIALFLLPVFYLASYALIVAYIGGDQVHYRSFYELASHAESISSLFYFGLSSLGAAEPLSLIILAAGALAGINKDVWISILNTFLLALLFIFLRKNQTNYSLVFLFLSSFYTVVLMTGAERLKIAYVFLLLAAITDGRFRILALLAASFSHFQSLILIAGLVALRLEEPLKIFFRRLALTRQVLGQILMLMLAGAIFFYFFSSVILSKLEHYLTLNIQPIELVQILVLVVSMLIYSRNRFRFILAMIPFFPAVLLLGGDRVNMIAFTVAMYMAISERSQNNLIVYLIMIYMTVKAIPFVQGIFLYGDGFVK